MSAEEGMECAATYREIFLENKKTMIVQPFPHVIETLRELHRCGFVLGMASSRNHCSLDGYVHQMLQLGLRLETMALPITHHFDGRKIYYLQVEG
jgi:phosphoglycolate phosphatase-like HAD superfamily hydrolase